MRQGFLGRYCFTRLQVSGDARYREQPLKDHYSHLHDALQYACLKFQRQWGGSANDSPLFVPCTEVNASFFGM